VPVGLVILSSSPTPPAGYIAMDQRLFASTDTGRLKQFKQMTIARAGAAAAVRGNQIFVLGGSGSPNGAIDANSNVDQIFDPATGAWSFGPPMPRRRVVFGAASIGNWIFVIGGQNEIGPMPNSEVLDGATWFNLPAMTTPRAGAAVAAIGRRVYALSGSPKPAALADFPKAKDNNLSRTGEYYDVDSGKWTLVKSESPVGFYAPATAVIGRKIYVWGGYTDDPEYRFSSLVFDTDTEQWSYISSAPPGSDLVWCSGGAVNNRVFSLGGMRYRQLQNTGIITEYSPEANAWWRVFQNSSPPRSLMASAVYQNSIYLFGGAEVLTNKPVYGNVEQFQPVESTYYLMKRS
jgi:N-acetylneuraminic acid mutarotase